MRVAIVVARFYEELADRLVAVIPVALEEVGIGSGRVGVYVLDFAFELPMAARIAAESGRYDAVVCLGAVIRGETTHYDYVCGEAARGIQDVQLSTGIPCGFGVLTVENLEQAMLRSGGDKRDSGRHAAGAVLALLDIKRQLAGG